jgi:hypothetical protein
MKCGNLNFLEPSGPLQACKGTALPFCNSTLEAWTFGNALYQLFDILLRSDVSTAVGRRGRGEQWMSPCWLTLRQRDLIAAAMPLYHLTIPKWLPTVLILIFMVFVSSSATIILTRTWQHNSALPQFQYNTYQETTALNVHVPPKYLNSSQMTQFYTLFSRTIVHVWPEHGSDCW